MKLKDNKRDIIFNKIFYSVREEININKSMWAIEDNQDIRDKQRLWIDDLTTSDFLIYNIYHEINRE